MMGDAVELKWVVSLSASACHLADLARRRLASEHPLVQAAAASAGWIGAELRAARIEETTFWAYLLPLSAQVENNNQLIAAVLRRILPPQQRDCINPVRLASCVAELEAAVSRAQPGLVDELAALAEHARAEWDERGPGLLRRIGELTDPGLIAQAATVAPVWPALGGCVSAHLPWNLVRIELGVTGPDRLPDLLSLTWLLAQLNLELPRYSETISPHRLPRLAALAMLPPTLHTAEDAGLTLPTSITYHAAIEAWRIDVPDPASVADKLGTWWQSYLDARPGWNVALAALEQMLTG
jgi:hypothetical protein